MARRLTFTHPVLVLDDLNETDGTYTYEDDETPCTRRVVHGHIDEHGQIVVIVVEKDSVSRTHLRDLADAAMESARRGLKVKNARMVGGRRSGAIRQSKARVRAAKLERAIKAKRETNPTLSKTDAIRNILKKQRDWHALTESEKRKKIKATLKSILAAKKERVELSSSYLR